MRNFLGKAGIAIIIILLLITVVFLQRNLDYKAEARRGFGKNIIYLPNAEYAKYLTVGYDNILADYLYLWSIQFFYEKTDKERFSIIENVFNIITHLDPDYIEAYRIGAIMMIKDVYKLHGDPEGLKMAFRLLNKGITNNPESWALPFEAATAAHFDLKDKKLANKYYQMAIESPTIPDKTRRRIS
ncbi:MAG: hypothetical protein JW737_00675, partial [Acidobacteria bacterium]|nr:hypothetical protein [Acidobacteriota bacterium]